MSRLLRLLAVVAAIAAASVTAAGSAAAAPDTLWCLNGKTTTLPTTVAGGGGAITLREGLADVLTRFTIGNDGVFQVGQVTPGGRIFVNIPDFRGDTGGFLPGFSNNVILRGPCVTVVAAVTHLGACKSGGLLRTDGTTGVFQEITVADWNDPKGRFFDATAANWLEGRGLTCDDPVALGYKAAGYSVSWGGKQDPGHQTNGVRGAGFNNIYPYYTK